MNKNLIFLSFISFACTASAQTGTRDNAGLQGDQGAASGFFETSQPSNYPTGATSWWHLLDVRHSNGANNYAMQFSGSFFDQDLYFRKTNNNAAQPWARVMTETDGYLAGGRGINIYTAAGQNFFTGHQAGSGYGFPSGIFHAVTDNPSGIPNIFYDGVTNGVTKFSVLANGQGYFAENIGVGTSTPTAQLHIFKNSPYTTDNDVAMIKLQNSASVQGYAELRALSDISDFRIGTGGTATSPAGSFAGSGYVNMVNDRSILLATNNTVRLFISNAVNNGNVGIGTTAPDSKLTVAGNIHSREVKVSVDAGADYVFQKDYALRPLKEVETYISQNQHLPEIASAAEMKEKGIELGDMNIKLLKKIEELTLYMIQQDKAIAEIKSENAAQRNEIEKLKSAKP